ncbi:MULTISPECIES: SDR family oxidoreductase [unclassified Sphingomonas]|uniref:SDR family oxidoreductase n=1 Tax=unclassified Sphingomonas TaxID=196159 RepID=UPI002269A202|nr:MULTISPECIES: SDR family oxidoreductase [unclassified Sphingomonas]
MTKTILITGTSSGLGRATAKLFQAKGWNVVATMRSPERETELNRLDRVLVTRLDVQDTASIETAIDAGIDAFGRIDVLVNNAGYGAYGPLEATSGESIRRQFDVNVLGPLATAKAIIPHFRANRAGTLVNIASIGGRLAFPLGALYHGTKFAIEGISEALHYELGMLGIRVKVIEPGAMKTDFAGRSFDFSNDESIPEYQPMVQSVMAAFGPFMEGGSSPEQVAELVHTAATDDSDHLRYAAGEDAEQILAKRAASSDDDFFRGIKAQFGID